MSAQHDWNQHYASGELPWDSGEPDPFLVDHVKQAALRGPVVEIGCGTGTNALWLAEQGIDVLAIDLAPLAIERARAKAAAKPAAVRERCTFEARNFLDEELARRGFVLAFDRGCFHVFDAPSDQQRFAARIAGLLAPGGHWLSLIGSTEGPARDMGPPRRSARDITSAIEPALELISLRTIEFEGPPDAAPPRAWLSLSRQRTVPAQPSTRYFSES